jgi:tRNA-specific adenosine deaminase 3
MQCAMGALHARFRRIFFIHASPTHGGLGSVFGLQSNQYVNHRFEVYQILYEQQQQQQPAGTA